MAFRYRGSWHVAQLLSPSLCQHRAHWILLAEKCLYLVPRCTPDLCSSQRSSAITSFFSSASPPFSLMLDNQNYPQGNLALICVLYAIHSPHTLIHWADLVLKRHWQQDTDNITETTETHSLFLNSLLFLLHVSISPESYYFTNPTEIHTHMHLLSPTHFSHSIRPLKIP